MWFANWLTNRKKRLNAQPDAPRYFSAKGNAIAPEWHSSWSPDDTGVNETRRHVGQSAEGFHAGIETVCRIGLGRIDWSDAWPTAERAMQAAWKRESAERDLVDGSSVVGQCLDKAR